MKILHKLQFFINFYFNLFILKAKRVQYESFPKINGRLFVINGGNIVLGRDVRINSGMKANPIGGDNICLLKTFTGGRISIGDNCGLSNCTIVAMNAVFIGEHTKIGGGVKMYDSDFHSLNYFHRRDSLTDKPLSNTINIGKDVFIGAHSIILKGVCIGDRVIVGAGSVVTKNIPNGQVWAGNPAKRIGDV
ncbi:acyltransferase [Agarivorans sp. Z349TD_8]|uniref:acyltransferase n=1 Tax=Agarivorans sp. Z349TD_8 TaxID=3421434 RepID=UPI003D7D119B